LDGFSASTGNGYVVLVLTLANQGSLIALSTNPVLFSLRTDRSLVISISPAQGANPCNPAFSVAVGGTITCSLAFEVPNGQTPSDLLYDDLRGNKATASVPPPAAVTPPDACKETDAWFQNPSSACSTCLDNVFSSTCKTIATNYDTSCTACSGSCDSASDPCACERQCDSTSCQSLFDALNKCTFDACQNVCP
jgi:hypothetical protein